jgi:hypothetical protein
MKYIVTIDSTLPLAEVEKMIRDAVGLANDPHWRGAFFTPPVQGFTVREAPSGLPSVLPSTAADAPAERTQP